MKEGRKQGRKEGRKGARKEGIEIWSCARNMIVIPTYCMEVYLQV
jgi:hypothetical protein